MSFELWTGDIFPTFKSTGFSTEYHFSTNEYIEKIKERFSSESNKSELSPLNLAISLLSGIKPCIDVVDFGGGCGSAIFNVNKLNFLKTKINYLNIDNIKIIDHFLEISSDLNINVRGAAEINSKEKFQINSDEINILLGIPVMHYPFPIAHFHHNLPNLF